MPENYDKILKVRCFSNNNYFILIIKKVFWRYFAEIKLANDKNIIGCNNFRLHHFNHALSECPDV